MFHLNEEFKGILSPAKWRNKVSKFLNNICGDGVVEVLRPDNPEPANPPRIQIRMRQLIQKLGENNFGGYKTDCTYDEGETAAQKLANAQALAEHAPKSDKYVDEEVTSTNTAQKIADNKIALIGTSNNLCREDHRHQIETAVGTMKFRPTTGTKTSDAQDETGHVTIPTGKEKKTDEWKPDNTNGFELLVCSRESCDDITDPSIHYLYFRPMKVSKNGNIIKIGAECAVVKVLA